MAELHDLQDQMDDIRLETAQVAQMLGMHAFAEAATHSVDADELFEAAVGDVKRRFGLKRKQARHAVVMCLQLHSFLRVLGEVAEASLAPDVDDDQ